MFTPGPWLIDMEYPIAVYEDDSAGRVICLMGTPWLPPRSEATTLANTHLIAAAPELYEACKKALTCASIDSSVRQVIVDAIAKAEGRS